MNFIIKFSSATFLLLLAISGYSQVILQPKQVEDQVKGIIYKSEKSFTARMHENGFAIGYSRGKILTFQKTKYYSFELGYTRDPREQKQNNNYTLSLFSSSNSFVFGKINSLINLRAAVGMKRYFSEKARRKGIALGYNLEAGPSIGILKPYYLDLIYTETVSSPAFEIRSERYSASNADVFLSDDIYGYSGFFKGFSELSIVPGFHGKAGLNFSIGAFEKYVKSLEAGIMADIFIKKMPILIESENISNKPYFLKLYLKFEIGVRKNNL